MITGAICLSHSPLIDHNRADSATEAGWTEAVERAGHFAAATASELAVIFYPDHLNGFLYNLLPAFCIGAGGFSIGDYGTAPGELDIAEEAAASCIAHCLAHDFDVAQSYRMPIDHGGAMAITLLAGHADPISIIPVFINCAALPRPSFARARALGKAIGDWARRRPERILLIGSGGLSHDPPLPTIALSAGDEAARLREGGQMSFAARAARQARTYAEGAMFAEGRSRLRPLNPDWDRHVMAAYARREFGGLEAASDDEISADGGAGAHELRCWHAALAALAAEQGSYDIEDSFYAPVKEWITGMGIITATSVVAG
ncbi:3-carboxyethylcatechol 2,3-dioxygenase [Sphingosinicella xenopeptidilytica]|uniref:3-carboxyethylcatechol 2,3-dioxygenase n=1 Tax=Sphingosinicella xenopeptidilytica TaxID=364098 RepID=A0ABW3C3F7_SPHXN